MEVYNFDNLDPVTSEPLAMQESVGALRLGRWKVILNEQVSYCRTLLSILLRRMRSRVPDGFETSPSCVFQALGPSFNIIYDTGSALSSLLAYKPHVLVTHIYSRHEEDYQPEKEPKNHPGLFQDA